MIYSLAGIFLGEGKKEMVYSRLSRVVHKEKHSSIQEYVNLVKKGTNKDRQHFINILTTNKTSFFRESYHFDILHSYLVNNIKSDPNPKIWCSAASTGEEVYTLAITLLEATSSSDFAGSILATDIDTSVLLQANEGSYRASDIDNVTTHDLSPYLKESTNRGMLDIIPELKTNITFKRHNLMEELNQDTKFSVIFCRNVMIYFNKETQRKILEMFKKKLAPGGLLFAGHSENFTYFASDLFRSIGKTVYCHAENEKSVADIIGTKNENK